MNNFHPISIFIFYASMIIPLTIVKNPAFSVCSVIGAIFMLFLIKKKNVSAKELFRYAAIFLIMSIINPLFVHRGSTPLLFLNGKAITLEAVIYGLNSSLQLVTALIWCVSFSIVMTSDRLFCLTGKLSPKITAMLTMAVRFIPELILQGKKINRYTLISPKFNKETSFLGKLKRILCVFSALITWIIENSICIADSMKARGFELGKRTSYSRYTFSMDDIILTSISLLCGLSAFFSCKKINMIFYPSIKAQHNIPITAFVLILQFCTYMLPIIFSSVIEYRRKNTKRK